MTSIHYIILNCSRRHCRVVVVVVVVIVVIVVVVVVVVLLLLLLLLFRENVLTFHVKQIICMNVMTQFL